MLFGKSDQTNPGPQGHSSHSGEIVKHLLCSLRVEKVSVGKVLLQSRSPARIQYFFFTQSKYYSNAEDAASLVLSVASEEEA